ncbi:MAG: YtxH domain-containing protein [Acidobacteria bacterium]|nr:YtxH domain-containing protein [Acidobacteriota bacterium]MBV9924812.1 YtxH domain-containing protein [Acidobacteriota bacterium]
MSEHQGRGRAGGDGDAGARLTYFAIGATIGAVVALLFAPKSGRELRQDVADATRKGVDRARETGSQLSARAGEYYETAQTRAGELATSAREAVSRRGELVGSAIEAGKQAYRDEKRRTESSALTENEPRALEGGQS